MNFFKTLGLSILCSIALSTFYPLYAQSKAERWQQAVAYTMDIDMDVKNHQFKGKQKLVYTNNSPDTLRRVFYHLYFNAFQPFSMMDLRSRNLRDPSRKIAAKLLSLKPNEIGYQKIISLKQDQTDLPYEVVGTILEVELAQAILPGGKTTFDMDFEAQVPVQIRRSGRDNAEGVSYSMSQWYPKLCEYDYQGWHANPYIAREFHGIWGSFDVTLHIDSSYVVGGTGYLQNPEEIGHGYLPPGKTLKRPQSPKLTWKFTAPQVHDFVWAADPDFNHDTLAMENGPTLHFFYQNIKTKTVENWKKLPPMIAKVVQFMNDTIGEYPFQQYSFIQGGDGGMEYPMATLILGDGSMGGLFGVAKHELIHSWFQGILANNESLYGWMDEGFDTYASNLYNGGDFPQKSSYNSYINLVKRGLEEPLSTHADHFNTNYAYGVGSYNKGCVYLSQLGYVIGQENLSQGLKKYYNAWKFKHPNPNDFIRVMEKQSGLELDWYNEYFINSTRFIDYGIASVNGKDNKTEITLERIGLMPMPIDLHVQLKNGETRVYYMPLRIMRGEKPQENPDVTWILQEDWPWTHPEYILELDVAADQIQKIEIDPSLLMADIERKNNVWDADASKEEDDSQQNKK